MRSILVLTLKDIRRRLASPAGVLLNLAIPMVLAGTMVLVFGGRGNDEEQAGPVLRLLVVARDDGPVARAITGASQNQEAARRLEIKVVQTRDEGLRRLREEEFAALVVVPEDFSDALLDGRPAELELVKNPAQSVMPIVAQQGGEVLALYLSIAATLLGDEGPRVLALFKGEGWEDATGIANLVVALRERIVGVDDYLIPPLIEIETAHKEEGEGGFDWASWMFPGMIVMSLMFAALTQMADILRERQWGTLRRQFAAPLSAAAVLTSKVLATAAVVGLALAGFLVMGTLFFGIRWGSPGPLLAVSILIVLGATGFAAVIFAIVRTERQGDAIGGVAVMLMSLLGGAFLPPQVLPEWLQKVSMGTISHWSNEALRALAAGRGWTGVAPYLPVLGILAAAPITLGIVLLGRRHARGSL